jgi:APA family basic amino acid/polyamine antiporter
VIIGLGSMVGAGVFAAFGPAARAAGNGFLVGLALAAVVAYCNATSSAQLAALYPESGGAYVYGRKRLSPFWGFVAGWGFVIGKLASCAAMAMTFGSYAAPALARPLAVSSVVVLTAVNYFGVQKTAIVTRAIVAIVLAALGTVVAAVWMGGSTDVRLLWPLHDVTPYGVLQDGGDLPQPQAGHARPLRHRSRRRADHLEEARTGRLPPPRVPRRATLRRPQGVERRQSLPIVSEGSWRGGPNGGPGSWS